MWSQVRSKEHSSISGKAKVRATESVLGDLTLESRDPAQVKGPSEKLWLAPSIGSPYSWPSSRTSDSARPTHHPCCLHSESLESGTTRAYRSGPPCVVTSDAAKGMNGGGPHPSTLAKPRAPEQSWAAGEGTGLLARHCFRKLSPVSIDSLRLRGAGAAHPKSLSRAFPSARVYSPWQFLSLMRSL